MRQARFLSPSHEADSSLYHCISRVVDRQFVLGREERDMLVQMMREYEAFCGVRVLSYCVMSNHFHLLVEVPPKVKDAPVEMSDDDFLKRMKTIYSKMYYRDIEQMIHRLRAQGADAATEEFKAKYTRRMHDLSSFMKGLKQRFTQWYNGNHGRRGTLWEGRFKSVLVQDGYAARVMAAYIDLNPTRAGMVERPEDYKWCSYGEAMQPKGGERAREGICQLLLGADAYDQQRDALKIKKGAATAETESVMTPVLSWEEGGAERYRMMLFADGEEAFADDIHSGVTPEMRKPKCVRKGFRRKDVETVMERGGKLTLGETLRCKVRYFSDGMTVGSKAFVEKVFQGARDQFGDKRKSGSRTLTGVGWREKKTRLYSMRELRRNPLE